MTVPVTFIGIITAIVSNSRLVRSRKPGAQCGFWHRRPSG
jgi:hypothetical protein